MDNFGVPSLIQLENQITVIDHGRFGSPFPRPLSQYLSPDIASRLLNSQHLQTLTTLDAEILSTDAIIVALKALSVFKRQIRNCHIPISTLPPEILGEIFMTAINDNVRSGITLPLITSMAMTLGGVCSSWRQVAWSLPRLWAVLYCSLLHPTNSIKEAGMIQQWLSRAKGLPLTIRIAFEDEEAWMGPSAPRDVLIALRRFSSTWESLQLVLPESWYGPLRSITSLGQLHILWLRSISSFHFNGKMLRGFSNAPNLSVLRYDGIYLNKLDVHWTNITKAFIGGLSLDEVLEFLKICPYITYCHLVNPTEARGTFSTAPIHQLFLEELYIATGQGEGVQGRGAAISTHTIIDLLTTPVLRKISLAISPQDVHNPLPPISNLIQRSQCPLRTVEVFGHDLGEDSVINLLTNSQPVLHIVNHV